MATRISLKRLFQGTLVALLVTACAAQPGTQVDWHENDSYAGWVTDAATGEPVEGAVIVAKWQLFPGRGCLRAAQNGLCASRRP